MSTGQVLLQLVEMCLDNILFRLGMASTITGAHQLVKHRYILVGHIINIPSFHCTPRDKIVALKTYSMLTGPEGSAKNRKIKLLKRIYLNAITRNKLLVIYEKLKTEDVNSKRTYIRNKLLPINRTNFMDERSIGISLCFTILLSLH